MVLEATMICVDNSDYMRNGDFIPTRLQAQQDAVGLVCHSKTQNNPENTVGLLTLAKTEVLSTLTTDVTKILVKLQQVQPCGDIGFITGLRIAHLALRHRQSRNQKMRIVVFVGSPVVEDDKEIIKLAKRLKKEKVSVDVINLDEDEANQKKLALFVETVNSAETGTSHLVTVPAGTMLHDSLITSPVIVGEDGSGVLRGYGMEFGVDPNEDPELALALRVSMEDQRARQEAEVSQNRRDAGITNPTDMMFGQADTAGIAGTNEDALLHEALALSMQQGSVNQPESIDFNAMTEEEQLNYALQMSLQAAVADTVEQPKENTVPTQEIMEVGSTETPLVSAAANPAAVPVTSTLQQIQTTQSNDLDDDTTELDVMADPSFLRAVLEQLPGVDPQSEELRSALSGGSTAQDPDHKKDHKNNTKPGSK